MLTPLAYSALSAPPPMPPPYQPPPMPNWQMPPPHHLQPPWAPPAGPLAAPIPTPHAFQQPGLGLRHDGQRAEPPPLGQPSHGFSPHLLALRPEDLRVKGDRTSLLSPFALEFGANLCARTSGGARDPLSKGNYAVICNSFKYLAHKDACSKWLAFGLCRDPNCQRLHDNWPAGMNGEVLNSKFRDLAQMAGVPQSWQPARRGRQ